MVLILNLAACSRGAEKKPRLNASRTPTVATKKVAALKISFSIKKRQFSKGAVVPVELVIENTSQEAIEMRFPSAKTHDFFVRNGDRKLIWQWSHGKLFAQAFRTKTLPSGKSMKVSAAWNQRTNQKLPVDVGKYYIEAELDAIGYGAKIGPLSINVVD